MNTQADILKKIKKEYPYLASEFGVKRIGLFGSVARQSEHADSDIDLIVEFNKPIGLRFIFFVEYIEKLLGKRVDVLTEEGIKNIRVKNVASSIKKDIIYV